MRARAILLAGFSLGVATLLAPSATHAAGWVAQNIWTAPDTARFVEFGPGRNDGTNRLYMPNNNSRVHEATWTGSTWTVVEIGSGTTGWAVSAAAIGDGRNDATQRIYGVSGDSVYEYSWTGSTWTRATLAIVSGNHPWVTVGSGRNDATNRIYAGHDNNNLYEYTWNGSTWPQTIVASEAGDINCVEVGNGRNDGVRRVYANVITGVNAIFEYTWSGSSWTKVTVGTVGGNVGIRIRDGRGDGIIRVYATSNDTHIYEFTYSGGAWAKTDLGANPATPGRCDTGLARHDGVTRLYSTQNVGQVEWTYSGGWSSATIISTGTGDTGVFAGRNDGVARVYKTGNPVYEITYDTVAPVAPVSPSTSNPGIGGRLSVYWVANTEADIKDYGVYRSTYSGGLGTKVLGTRVAHPGTTHQDAGLVNSTTYYYQVTARDASLNESGGSSEAQAYPTGGADTTPPAAITNLTATTQAQVLLSWTAPSDNVGVTAYLVRYSTVAAIATEGDWSAAVGVGASLVPAPLSPGTTQTAVITGLKPRTTYWFAIKSQDAAANLSALDTSSPEPSASAGSFVLAQEPSGVTGPGNGETAWGDYDNDGDLDLVVKGKDGVGSRFRIYRNDAGTFNLVQEPAGATSPWGDGGGASWGDYDGDGDLDLVVNGYDGTNFKFGVWRNDGGTFVLVQEPAGSAGPGSGMSAWGDYDNDGDLDIAVNGADGGGNRFRVYRNDGGTFNLAQEPAGTTGPGHLGYLAWGDYDNDGDLDLAVMGTDATANRFRVYRNDGGTFNLAQEPSGAIGPGQGGLAWGDYDNDGDLDIAIAGYDGTNYRSRIYRNDAGTFNLVQEPVGATGLGAWGAWGDYDNDGDLDLVFSGYNGSQYPVKIYRNDAGTFNLAQEPAGASGPSQVVVWGDYDGDGDLDFAAQGHDGTAYRFRVYKSLEADYGNVNTAPTTPGSAFVVTYSSVTQTVTFNWGAGSDAESGANALYYQVRAGTVSTQGTTISGVYGSPLLGTQPRPKVSGSQLGRSLQHVMSGTTMYWAVRTIDTGLRASVWSVERTTVIASDIISPIAPVWGGLSTGTAGRMNIFWVANTESDLKDYRVWRGTYNAQYVNPVPYKLPVAAVLKSGTTHQDTGLTDGATYFYQLTARDVNGNESDASSEVSAVGGGDTTPPAGLTWASETVDSAGDVGGYTALAVDTAGNSHISYYDGTNQRAKYAGKNGSAWAPETVDGSANRGAYTGIGLDGSGLAHISYADLTNADLRYARRTGGTWALELVDSTGSVGNYSRLAVGGGDVVHISYYDTTNLDLKYAKRSSGTWTLQTVDSAGDVGGDTDIAVDAAGNPYIAYFDSTNSALKMAKWTGSVWNIQTVDAGGNAGHYPRIVLDSTGSVHIVHWALSASDLRYAKWDGTSWSLSTIDAGGDTGRWPSIALDGAGNPHVSYFDNTNGDLKYARWTGTTWSTSTVDSAGVTGGYSSIAIGSDGNPRVAYYDQTNGDLRQARVTAGGGFPQPVKSAYPTGLGATVYTSSITWTWTDNATNEQGYRVRSSTGADLSGTLAANTVLWTETGLSSGTAYTRYVQVYNAGGVANSSPLTATTLSGADTTPPAVVSGLSVSAGTGLVNLTWTANTEGDLKDYRIRQSTVSGISAATPVLATIIAPGTTHRDGGLAGNTTYFYRLSARDVSLNESGLSVEVSTRPGAAGDTTPPATPTGLTVTQPAQDRTLVISWSANTEPDFSQYRLYKGTFSGTQGSKTTIITVTVTGYTEGGLLDGTTYYYQLVAVDGSANASGPTAEVSGVTRGGVDVTPPAAISDLTALAGTNDGQVGLAWTAPGDDGMTGTATTYELRRATYQITTPAEYSAAVVVATASWVGSAAPALAGTASSTTIVGLNPGVTYYFSMKASDEAGNWGSLAAPANNWVPAQNGPPNAPATPNASSPGSGVVNLYWTANTEADLKDYRIWRATSTGALGTKALVRTVAASGTTHQDAGLTQSINYFYQLTARDTVGYESGGSGERIIFAGDAVAPSSPTALGVTNPNLGGRLTLSWAANTESDLKDYQTWRSTFSSALSAKSSTTALAAPGTTHQDAGLANGTSYYYQITARDTSGNGSGGSPEAFAYPTGGGDTTPPTAPTGLGVTTPAQVSRSLDLTWTANTEGDLKDYRLWRSTNSGVTLVSSHTVATVSGSSMTYRDGQLPGGGTFSYRLTARDTSNNESGGSAEVVGNPAPGMPTGLTLSTGPSVANLAWVGPGDLDLKDYRVYRATVSGGVPTKIIVAAVQNGTTHQDAGLPGPSTTYFYQVTARDTSLQESAGSAEVSTAGDATPPAAPATLWLAPAAGAIDLNWAANTEADLKDYGVYRATLSAGIGSKILTGRILAPGTTHRDAGLVSGTTYYYQVTARDVSLNESGGSVEKSTFPAGGGADVTPPVARMTVPAPNSTVGTPPAIIYGTASDTETGVAQVKLFLRRGSDNYQWAGSSWSPNITWFVAAGTSSWSYDVGSVTWSTGAYTVNIQAWDGTGNVSLALTEQFIYGATGILRVTAPSTATVGGAFSVTVEAVDGFGAVVTSASGTVTLATSDPYDTEPAAAALVGGARTFSVTLVTASSVTLTGTGAVYISGSTTTVVAAGAAAALQVILPGEVAAAGKTSAPAGKTGAPISQKSGVAFTATVNAVDAYWNIVPAVVVVTTVTTSDPNDNDREPAAAALAAGTRGFLVAPVTLGNVTVTASATGYASATSAAVLITNATPPAAPSGLTATPQEGATIRLAWTVSTSADVVSYRIYYATATSLLNFAAPSATVAHPTSSYVTPVLTAGQTYSFVVRAVNVSGNEETNANVVTAQALATLTGAVRARVAWPLNGSRVAGARMTVIGEVTAGADRLASIRFDYRPEASSVWTTITPALAGFPNPDGTAPYFIPWDMRSLPLGNYRLRAVAADRDGNLDPAAAEVSITHVAPADVDLEDTVTSRGERQVRQVVRRDQDNRVRVGDERGEVTEVRIPAGALVSTQTVVRIVLNPADSSPAQAGLNSLGRTRRISFEDGTRVLSSSFTVRISFRQDSAGNIQGTRATPRALLYCRLNPATGRYQLVSISALYNSTRKRWEDAKGNEITPPSGRSSAPALAGGPALAETASDGTSAVEAETNQDGDYALFIGAAENLDLTLVYPNPFRPNSDATHTDITFANLTEESTIEVLTVAGERVWMKEKVVGRESWSGTNTDGEPVTTGVYVYIITSKEGQKSIGKLAVIR